MIPRPTLNKIIIISFMVLIGFSLAKAIYHGSFMGIVLALVALGAAVYFLYIIAKANEEMLPWPADREAEEASQRFSSIAMISFFSFSWEICASTKFR